MKKIILVALLALTANYSNSQDFLLKTSPASDGCVLDKNNDKIADKVNSTISDSKKTNAVLSITNSVDGSATTKSVFEFKVPQKIQSEKITKAILTICLNWAYDMDKKTKGKGPELEVWGYFDKNADGKVMLNDYNAGKSLNITIKRDCTFKQKRYLELDITKFVKTALKNKAEYIALRFDPKRTQPIEKVKMWTWRSSEFGEKFGKKFVPTLKISCNKITDQKKK